jgi:hypothetical protein
MQWALAAHAEGEEAVLAYRFGDWTLVSPAPLETGTQSIRLGTEGMEFQIYWKNGRERALSFHFAASEEEADRSLIRSGRSVTRFAGCKPRGGGRIASMPKLPPREELPPLPDGSALLMGDTERGLRRQGELLIVDLKCHRTQIASDSPLVRAGEWDSADFCRYELRYESEDEE